MDPELRPEHRLGEDTVGRDATRHQTDSQQYGKAELVQERKVRGRGQE